MDRPMNFDAENGCRKPSREEESGVGSPPAESHAEPDGLGQQPEAEALGQFEPAQGEPDASAQIEPNPPPAGEPSANGRDEQGRFAKGNLGGPGNPFARQVAALRQALLDAVTPEDIHEIAQSLVAKARKGDLPAARLVLAYAIGKPGPAPDPDALDLHEWSIFQRSGIDATEVDKLRHQMPVGVANPLHRVLQPIREQEVAQTMTYMLKGPAERKKALREAKKEARRRHRRNGRD